MSDPITTGPTTIKAAQEIGATAGIPWQEIVTVLFQLLPLLELCAGSVAGGPAWARGDGLVFFKRVRTGARQNLVLVRARDNAPAGLTERQVESFAQAVLRHLLTASQATMAALDREEKQARRQRPEPFDPRDR